MNWIKITKRAIAPLAILLLLLIPLAGCAGEDDPDLITSYAALMQAVKEAADGDVLLVGDIDFLPTSPTVVHSYMCIEIERSITIKSGKRDGAAVFRNGGFKLIGSKVTGEGSAITFEDIIFDGCADYDGMVAADFNYPWSDTEQAYTMFVPHDAQQALSFAGNVDATFRGCTFRGYMHEYGPVIDLRYADYTDNPYLSDAYVDHSGCKIALTLEDCVIENNSAYYDGGAIYIEANRNVTLTVRDTVFRGNRSGRGEYRRGGGAIYAEGAILDLQRCTLDGNLANHSYPGLDLPETDTNRGGAMQLAASELRMVDCNVTANRASLGGGISLTNTAADIDGCFFTENRAEQESLNPYGTIGPWSNMALGGAIYLEGMNASTVALTNCTVENNSAQTAYGGIYAFYSGFDDPNNPAYRLKLTLCTYADNRVDATYDYTDLDPKFIWFSHPGDITRNTNLTFFGCVVADPDFASTFPHNESPTAENGYNHIAAERPTEAVAIPLEAARTVLGERYGEQLKKVFVGENYDADLYREVSGTAALWLIPGVLVAVLAALCAVLLVRRRAASAPAAEPAVEVEPTPQIVMTRYSDEEIDRFLAAVPETHLLTPRELEVLRELLYGRKQGEVAYYLGIEVSTVKDYYRKIYGKLQVDNKDGLFRLVSGQLQDK